MISVKSFGIPFKIHTAGIDCKLAVLNEPENYQSIECLKFERRHLIEWLVLNLMQCMEWTGDDAPSTDPPLGTFGSMFCFGSGPDLRPKDIDLNSIFIAIIWHI